MYPHHCTKPRVSVHWPDGSRCARTPLEPKVADVLPHLIGPKYAWRTFRDFREPTYERMYVRSVKFDYIYPRFPHLSKSKPMKPINRTLKEYGRGLGGGLLFSLPMLYTMELWSTGFIAGPARLVVYLSVGIVLLMGYNLFVGLRGDRTLFASLLESVEGMGMALMVTALILWLIGVLEPGMSGREIMGKVVVESLTVAIGISVGKSQLGSGGGGSEEDDGDGAREVNFWAQLAMALCGAVLIASNVAPTEEVVVIALGTAPVKLLLIAILSMGTGAVILYFSDFTGTDGSVAEPHGGWDILAGTLVMYSVALVSSAFMLWFFGRLEGLSLYTAVSEVVVLSFPGAMGASAGRLLLQN